MEFMPMFQEPTPEEKEEMERQLKEALSKGEPSYSLMDSFNPNKVCVKCGTTHNVKPMRVRYIAKGKYPEYMGDNDCIATTCRGCGYVELQKCKDAEPTRA